MEQTYGASELFGAALLDRLGELVLHSRQGPQAAIHARHSGLLPDSPSKTNVKGIEGCGTWSQDRQTGCSVFRPKTVRVAGR